MFLRVRSPDPICILRDVAEMTVVKEKESKALQRKYLEKKKHAKRWCVGLKCPRFAISRATAAKMSSEIQVSILHQQRPQAQRTVGVH